MDSGKECTVTQLVTTVHESSAILDDSGQVDVIFLGFCKAFDKVSHGKLLYKLDCLSLPSCIIGWIAAYFKKQNSVWRC